jgi:hypothetical protein
MGYSSLKTSCKSEELIIVVISFRVSTLGTDCKWEWDRQIRENTYALPE